MVLKRDVPIAPNANVLVEVASPILLLLGRLKAGLMQARFADLMDQLATAIDDFEREVRQRGVAAQTARDAKYALAATADDIVQHIPSEDRQIWTQYSMLSRFFGERIGGVRFFEMLDQAKLDPRTNFDLLELMSVCLSVGFEGVYRSSGGAVTLQAIQRQLYEILRSVRPRTALDLSPHWRGLALPAMALRASVPIWLIAAFAAAILAVTFVTARVLLGGSADTVAGEVQRLVPMDAMVLARRPAAAPPPPPPVSNQAECIRNELAAEVAAGRITVIESGTSVVLRIGAFASFPSGQAVVLEAFVPSALRIGSILEKYPGPIRIIGHSDSTPIASARFASNWHLSVARADAVAAIIRRQLSQPNRVVTEGRGADQPLASEDTPEGKARNRRVELLVPKEALQTCP